ARPDRTGARRHWPLAAERRGVRRLARPRRRRSVRTVGRDPLPPAGGGCCPAGRGSGGLPQAEERLMGPIFKAQLLNLVRNPWGVLIMTFLTIAMSFIFGYQATNTIRVGVLPATDLSEAQTEE